MPCPTVGSHAASASRAAAVSHAASASCPGLCISCSLCVFECLVVPHCFYDSEEDTWYAGPDTELSTHLFPGCAVYDNVLNYWGGQTNWGNGCCGIDLTRHEGK